MKKISNKSFDFVIFDFDGVIVDSTALKTSAFKQVISNYNEDDQKTFLHYHKLNGGVSRWKKFEYFCREILKLDSEDAIAFTSKLLADQFTKILEQKIPSLKLTDGSIVLLEKLKRLKKPCFIVSGAKESEVNLIAKNNRIESYFEFILGSPKNKQENLQLLKNLKKLNGTGLFIGDSYTDFISALDFKINFVFMSNHSEWLDWKKNEKDFYLKIKSLKELEELLIDEDN